MRKIFEGVSNHYNGSADCLARCGTLWNGYGGRRDKTIVPHTVFDRISEERDTFGSDTEIVRMRFTIHTKREYATDADAALDALRSRFDNARFDNAHWLVVACQFARDEGPEVKDASNETRVEYDLFLELRVADPAVRAS